MLNYDFGIVNWFIGLLGMPKVNWLGDPAVAMLMLIATDIWTETPFSLLVFSAGLEWTSLQLSRSARFTKSTRKQENWQSGSSCSAICGRIRGWIRW